jgi:hypothetical protein
MKKLLTGTQESLVALLCYDKESAKQVAALLTPKTFDPYYRELAEEATTYIQQYNEPPGEHTYDIVESLKARNPDQATLWDRLFSSLKSTKDVINKKHVLDRAGVFARKQACKVAIQKAMPLLNRDTDSAVDEVEAILSGVGKKSLDLSSPGLLLNDPEQALRFLDRMEDDAMPTGIKELDEVALGPARGKLWLLVAPSNAGKTWSAVQLGKMGVLHRKRVLHVTLEMSEHEIAQRYCQSLFAVTKRQADDLISRRFKLDEVGRFIGFKDASLKDRPAITDPNIRQYLLKKLSPMKQRTQLIIKQFPTGQLTIRMLNAYLDRLEATMKFMPDEILLDYPDLMAVDSKNYRHALDEIYKSLRGIAVERNLAIAVYSQSNKSTFGAKLIGMGKASEDVRKEATADTIITYNQTDAEYQLGLARLYVAKARGEQKHFQILLSQLYAMGQFVMDSCRMVDSSYWPTINGSGDDEE